MGEQIREGQAWFVERRERSIVEKENTLKPWSVPAHISIRSLGQYLTIIRDVLISSKVVPIQAKYARHVPGKQDKVCSNFSSGSLPILQTLSFSSIYGAIMLQSNDSFLLCQSMIWEFSKWTHFARFLSLADWLTSNQSEIG